MKILVKRIAAVLLAILMSGCIVLPVPMTGDEDTRGNVTKEKIKRFEAGKTTLAEVVLLLGEPDDIHYDGMEISYEWRKNRWGIAWLLLGPDAGFGGAFKFGDDHKLWMHFDANYRLLEYKKIKDKGYKGHESF